LDETAGGTDPQVILQDRLKKGKERLDQAIETLVLLVEPVDQAKGELGYIHYFCGNSEIPTDLQEREPIRVALYRGVAGLVRAFANLANDLVSAGYEVNDVARIKGQIDQFLKIREIVRKASGESIDFKAYEADMRHLIDTYIVASEPVKISPFDDIPLLELIVKTGIDDVVNGPLGNMGGNQGAVAETIENNVRKKIIKEHLGDPEFYDRMSKLLDELIQARRASQIEYAEYLKKIAELAKQVQTVKSDDSPSSLDSQGKRALYNNLGKNEELALRVHDAVLKSRPDAWRGVRTRENVIKQALFGVLGSEARVEEIFAIIKANGEY
jgi:type I restriction enzyme R subunit